MNILHQLGHRNNWNWEVYDGNSIGEGFIYGAFNTTHSNISDLSKEKLQLSSIDLQYYGKRASNNLGQLNTYPFHPANWIKSDKTVVNELPSISKGIKYQENIGFKKIIIPNYLHTQDIDYSIQLIKQINKYLRLNKNDKHTYYLTLPISKETIKNDYDVERILLVLTDMNIVFDGYYVVVEPSLDYKQKISIDYNYLDNLLKIFEVFHKHKFKTIYGYANFDAIIFSSIVDIDYITIGTYENLRNFNLVRYSSSISGGPSRGWYFSEKILNFIKAQQIAFVNRRKCLDLIKNDKNIFSDIILNDGYVWSAARPDIHKNYLLSVSRLLININSINIIDKRIQHTINLIKNAQDVYRALANRSVFLPDESSDYHLGTWLSFLRSKV